MVPKTKRSIANFKPSFTYLPELVRLTPLEPWLLKKWKYCKGCYRIEIKQWINLSIPSVLEEEIIFPGSVTTLSCSFSFTSFSLFFIVSLIFLCSFPKHELRLFLINFVLKLPLFKSIHFIPFSFTSCFCFHSCLDFKWFVSKTIPFFIDLIWQWKIKQKTVNES